MLMLLCWGIGVGACVLGLVCMQLSNFQLPDEEYVLS